MPDHQQAGETLPRLGVAAARRGEDTAALRLLAKVPDLYGSRFFDILLLDALYTQAPMLEWHAK